MPYSPPYAPAYRVRDELVFSNQHGIPISIHFCEKGRFEIEIEIGDGRWVGGGVLQAQDFDTMLQDLMIRFV